MSASGSLHTCPHGKCAANGALSTNCNEACIGTICQQDSFCCTTQWDDQCVGEALTLCGSLLCAEHRGICTHSPCATGVALQPSCDDPPVHLSCVLEVCQQDPFCCDAALGRWDSICIAEITSTCGFTCD